MGEESGKTPAGAEKTAGTEKTAGMKVWLGVGIGAGIGSAAIAAALLYANRAKDRPARPRGGKDGDRD